MLIGEYTHTIDTKSRISLPAKFRKEMGRKVVITPGLDKCLFIFTMKEWVKFSKELSGDLAASHWLKNDTRTFSRLIFGGAVETEVDSIGRILLPDFLKTQANLSEKASLVGVDNRVEVWNDKTWANYKKGAESKADELAEKLGSEK